MTRPLKVAGVLAALACAGLLQAQQGKPPAAAQAPQPPRAPLSPMTSEQVLVLPVQLLRADSGAWVDQSGWEAFRRELDDSIGAAIASRGVGRRWKYASDAVRIAKRNPDYVSDVYNMGVQSLRLAKFKTGDLIPDLFNNNLRLLIGIADARYALVPYEAWFVTRNGQQIVVLRLALVDGRAGSFVWFGEVGTDPSATRPRSITGILASRVADLVAVQ